MNERFATIASNKTYILIGAICFGGGVGVGYFLGKRSKEPTYHVIPPKQVFDKEAMEEFIQEKEKALGIDPSEKASNFVKEKLETIVVPIIEIEDMTVEVPHSVFAESAAIDDNWNYEEELKYRTPASPYVIHQDEFHANELDYMQSTLTYYAGDDILCDEDDTPVYNHDTVVGPMRFGHGSGDPKVFHVRNDERKAEYEIIHDAGYYSVEILGIEMEQNDRANGLKHSGVPKFKRE